MDLQYLVSLLLNICEWFLQCSTSSKFSRHLIFHLPGAVFKDNINVGKVDITVQYSNYFTHVSNVFVDY